MSQLLIYGATGYTGSMVARQAKMAGLDVTLAGRDATKLAALAHDLDVPYSALALDTGSPYLRSSIAHPAFVRDRTEPGTVAWRQRTVVNLHAKVRCLGIGDHRARVTNGL